MSVLTQVTVDGEPLPIDDVVLNCDSLFVGGTENVRQTLAAGCSRSWSTRRSGSGSAPTSTGVSATAVDEILRFTSSGLHTMRRATRPVELGGRAVAEGDLLVCWLPSANRDAAQFTDPGVFDVTRTPNRHLALGVGPHYCVGTQLAKLEIRAVLREFLAQARDVTLDGPVERLDSLVVGGPRRLPLRLT